jgi:peptide/nickel transport system substrate-binding protein
VGKWPTGKQWTRFFKILTFRERWIVRSLIFIILGSCLTLLILFYLENTIIEPRIGGEYREGIFGQPRYINPVLSQTNDTDRDLVQLIYSSLFKYDNQGNLITDLAERYEIGEEGLVYTVFLKENVYWHNGEKFSADDVIFTIKTIQDPEYNSPLRNIWLGVEIEKIDEFTVSFKLSSIYANFLHNLTVGILPKHLWAGISGQNFPLAVYNLKPIGSGPYKFEEFAKNEEGQIESMELTYNENFYLLFKDRIQGPFIKKIIFKFYNSQESLTKAYQQRQIDGLSSLSTSNQSKIRNNLTIYEIKMPIYYAVFFNQNKSKALADKTVRMALAYAINKEKIIDEVLNGKGTRVDSPLLPNWPNCALETNIYEFALEHAQNILEAEGWVDSDNDNIREKEETKLEIEMLVTDWSEIRRTAELIREQWEKIGVKINLKIVEASVIQKDYIRPREYQALLFGEILGADPDPFAFWHSSQKKDPGLNLSLYQNKEVDKLLQDARQTLDQTVRQEKYAEFQKLLIEDIPCIFLYSPSYIYPVNKKVKGISIEKMTEPSQRFSQVENWYIKTKRIWK